MKLTFIGVGAAFEYDNFQSNMLLEADGRRLLIDAGDDSRRALHRIGLSYLDLHAVYISHLHGDHVHGMEWLALKTHFDPAFVDEAGSPRKLTLFIRANLADPLWDNVMKGGAATLQGERNTLTSYFDVERVPKNGSFKFGGCKFKLVQTIHYVDDCEVVPSYGLFWTGPDGRNVFLTTDTQLMPNWTRTFYSKADIIFQDCETAPKPSGIHAYYDDLKKLPPEIKKKMWLYHYQDGTTPDAVKDGFAGFVEQGQTFDFSAKR